MAAGLGFKDFVTGEVLTAADVDGYLMQGVWVFASAAARDAAVTSPQEGNFAYLKDTNVTTYYTGSAWANLDTTGMTNPMTTTGDTIYSSSGSTPARLGIGTTGQVLTVAGGIPSWATPAGGGGLTLINTGGTALSTATTTVSSIPGTYKNLFIVVEKAYVASDAGNAGVYIRFNSDSGSNYTYQTINSINTTLSGRGDATQTLIELSARISDQNTDIKKLFAEMTVRNYTNTDGVGFSSASNSFNNSEQPVVTLGAGSYDGAAAITSVTISTDSTFSGGTIFVYGVN